MIDSYELEMDDLAVNLTKPAVKFGVPFMPFFLSVCLCFFGWMLYQSITGCSDLTGILIFLSLWCLSYIFMFLITSKDNFGLKIFWINLLYFKKSPTFAFWNNTDSFQP